MPDILTGILEPGMTATILLLVVWLVRRVFTHTIPRLASDFKEALAEQQRQFLKHMYEQRLDYKAELAEQRLDFKETLRGERDFLGRKLDRLADAVEALIRETPL